eukprot:15452314-Alexandrium_andersonii.AAC.3
MSYSRMRDPCWQANNKYEQPECDNAQSKQIKTPAAPRLSARRNNPLRDGSSQRRAQQQCVCVCLFADILSNACNIHV